MATPSSSATSPSPPMAYLPHSPPPAQSVPSASTDPQERELRKRAVQKFLARAEISMVTRALRARLSYASYKATHNIPHVPLRDLEAQTQTQSQTASFSRTIAAKRKASGTNNYYNNPATQSPTGMGAGGNTVRRGGSGTMAPPSTVLSPRTHYPAVNGISATSSSRDMAGGSQNANATQSLYTSILAPPPAKHARTIHNASDPPVAAPSRPAASPRMHGAKASSRSIAEGTRAHVKGRQSDKASGSPEKRKTKRTTADKGKQKQRRVGADVDADGDVDMKAAATLTSLLLHNRPSIAGSASSPRSSIDGSDAGSAYSYSHFAQSSARTTTAAAPTPLSAAESSSTIPDSSFRNQTPPPATTAMNVQSVTPGPAPTDNEAANLMLYLATSPSPARSPNKDSQDLAAYRALGGGGAALRAKGRVLFPSGVPAETSGPEEPAVGGTPIRAGSALTRNTDNGFTSSISSIGTDMGTRSSGDPAIVRTTSLPSQLLPPPPFASVVSGSPSMKDLNQSPRPMYGSTAVEFNFNDFIHASPSPLRGPVSQVQKANLGLRADVGRKLFEEDQMRYTLSRQSPGKRQEEQGLGAGIDLAQS